MYDPWRTLSILSKHLPPSAQVIVSLPNVGHANILRDLANGYWHYKGFGLLDITHIRFFTLFEMQKMFYETGFRIVSTYFSVEYCVTPEKYPPNSFPAWVNFGEVKMIVKSYEHFLSLNSRQIFFNIQRAADAELSAWEKDFILTPHPKTWAY